MQIEYDGNIHEMPDDWSDKDVAAALKAYDEEAKLTVPTQAKFSEAERAILAEQHSSFDPGGVKFEDNLVPLNEEQQKFVSIIKQMETGNLQNEWIRTKITDSASTAYGSFQLTRGLLRGYLEDFPAMFTEDEQRAAQELIARQSVAIAVGGVDRVKYEKGGINHAQAQVWAQQYNYATVGEMLDAFGYGGDYGLANDVNFQLHYENIARKIMIDHLTKAKDNMLEAASVYHGGPAWNSGKYKKDTELYRKKFQLLLDKELAKE